MAKFVDTNKTKAIADSIKNIALKIYGLNQSKKILLCPPLLLEPFDEPVVYTDEFYKILSRFIDENIAREISNRFSGLIPRLSVDFLCELEERLQEICSLKEHPWFKERVYALLYSLVNRHFCTKYHKLGKPLIEYSLEESTNGVLWDYMDPQIHEKILPFCVPNIIELIKISHTNLEAINKRINKIKHLQKNSPFVVIMGPPAIGKTYLTLVYALKSIEEGRPVFYISYMLENRENIIQGLKRLLEVSNTELEIKPIIIIDGINADSYGIKMIRDLAKIAKKLSEYLDMLIIVTYSPQQENILWYMSGGVLTTQNTIKLGLEYLEDLLKENKFFSFIKLQLKNLGIISDKTLISNVKNYLLNVIEKIKNTRAPSKIPKTLNLLDVILGLAGNDNLIDILIKYMKLKTGIMEKIFIRTVLVLVAISTVCNRLLFVGNLIDILKKIPSIKTMYVSNIEPIIRSNFEKILKLGYIVIDDGKIALYHRKIAWQIVKSLQEEDILIADLLKSNEPIAVKMALSIKALYKTITEKDILDYINNLNIMDIIQIYILGSLGKRVLEDEFFMKLLDLFPGEILLMPQRVLENFEKDTYEFISRLRLNNIVFNDDFKQILKDAPLVAIAGLFPFLLISNDLEVFLRKFESLLMEKIKQESLFSVAFFLIYLNISVEISKNIRRFAVEFLSKVKNILRNKLADENEIKKAPNFVLGFILLSLQELNENLTSEFLSIYKKFMFSEQFGEKIQKEPLFSTLFLLFPLMMLESHWSLNDIIELLRFHEEKILTISFVRKFQEEHALYIFPFLNLFDNKIKQEIAKILDIKAFKERLKRDIDEVKNMLSVLDIIPKEFISVTDEILRLVEGLALLSGYYNKLLIDSGLIRSLEDIATDPRISFVVSRLMMLDAYHYMKHYAEVHLSELLYF